MQQEGRRGTKRKSAGMVEGEERYTAANSPMPSHEEERIPQPVTLSHSKTAGSKTALASPIPPRQLNHKAETTIQRDDVRSEATATVSRSNQQSMAPSPNLIVLSEDNRRILNLVIDVIVVAGCSVSVDTLQACTSLGDEKLVIALGEGVACGLLTTSNNKYAVVNDVRKRVSPCCQLFVLCMSLLYSHVVLSCLCSAFPTFKILLQVFSM